MNYSVNYKLFDKRGELIKQYKRAACFSSLYSYSWHKMSVHVEDNKRTKDVRDWYVDLILKIEPSAKKEIIDDELWVTFPFMGEDRKKKLLLILSALRYAWEEGYCQIPEWTKTIIDRNPDIDPLKAIIIANSNLLTGYGGHSIVPANQLAKVLRGTWHYRRFKGDRVHSFTLPKEQLQADYGGGPEVNAFRQKRGDINNLDTVLKHYGYK